ncbi:iron-containing alcohol dehydrogenase [Shimia thalassica]|uniref:iron-containing alcohol dehydrogenase n=1 Tax=Shimia thalassica TaxID=1715693 RepID=UPI0026E460A9|nr:iron-containing alcohol dehydrogenase [Shimia thalassica]MDO6482388.1 iron-containing alcohol dehydrogenase [Shimia thalassica]
MFSFISPQALHFGRGQSQKVAQFAKEFGETALVVHGASAQRAAWLIALVQDAGLETRMISCANEPSLPDIEKALLSLDGWKPSVVIALGGGSVMDFAKALSALMGCKGPVQSYLEIIGDGRSLDAAPIPVIALPTTAGTGAEVTKNAVISVPEHGLKVSLRDPRMVPDIAIMDADLMQGAPRHIALAAGLDAVTQVIEPYLSSKSNPMTDALCRAAIPDGLKALRAVVETDSAEAWDVLAWVSTCGGLALANAGLGAVHGFAGVIGGKTGAPHGEICGRLLPFVLDAHCQKAQKNTAVHDRLTWVLDHLDQVFANGQKGQGRAALMNWSAQMGLRNLRQMDVSSHDFATIAEMANDSSSMKGNPFKLTIPEVLAILHREALAS